MITKCREYGSEAVEHCSIFAFRFVSQNIRKRLQNGGGFSRCTLPICFGHVLVRFADLWFCYVFICDFASGHQALSVLRKSFLSITDSFYHVANWPWSMVLTPGPLVSSLNKPRKLYQVFYMPNVDILLDVLFTHAHKMYLRNYLRKPASFLNINSQPHSWNFDAT